MNDYPVRIDKKLSRKIFFNKKKTLSKLHSTFSAVLEILV